MENEINVIKIIEDFLYEPLLKRRAAALAIKILGLNFALHLTNKFALQDVAIQPLVGKLLTANESDYKITEDLSLLITIVLRSENVILRCLGAGVLPYFLIDSSQILNDLINRLETDKDIRVRCYAAETLGSLGDIRFIEYFASILMSSNENEEMLATAILVLDKWYKEHEDKKIYKVLFKIFIDHNFASSIRAMSLKVLSEYNNNDIIELQIRILTEKSTSDKLKITAIYGLEKQKVVRAIPILIQMFTEFSETIEVRIAATIALGKIGDARATSFLLQALTDEQKQIRMCAEKALIDLKDFLVMDQIIQYLNYPKAFTRYSALKILQNIGDERALVSLQILQNNDFTEVEGNLLSSMAADTIQIINLRIKSVPSFKEVDPTIAKAMKKLRREFKHK